MAKFGIVTINYKRPQVFELWVESIKRLRTLVGFFPVVCVSEYEDETICRKNDIHFIHRQNRPVTKKWNKGFDWLRTQDVDYVIIVGSDDIISNELMNNLITAMDKDYDLIGIHEIFFFGTYGLYRNKLYRLNKNKMLGVCKTIHRRILDRIDWKPFPLERNYGMDGMVSRLINPIVKSSCTVEGLCCDIKTKESLNRITFWARKIGHAEDNSVLFRHLSENEIKLLKQL